MKVTVPTLAVSYVILALLVGMVTFAYPGFRVKRHNTFEVTHRFAGWTAVALVWAQVGCLIWLHYRRTYTDRMVEQVVLLINDYKTPDEKLGHALVHTPSFWLVVVFTVSIILPWVRLRKYPVRIEKSSDHCVRLYFDYGAC